MFLQILFKDDVPGTNESILMRSKDKRILKIPLSFSDRLITDDGGMFE